MFKKCLPHTGGRELRLLCGFNIINQYTLLQNRDNSGLSVYCSLKLGPGATGLLNKLKEGGASNRLPGLVTKQQAVEFPHVQVYWLVIHNYANFPIENIWHILGIYMRII